MNETVGEIGLHKTTEEESRMIAAITGTFERRLEDTRLSVDEMLEPPTVGKFYLVPGIEYRFFSTNSWYPLMGTLHDDKEHLGFPYEHYHPDWRFMPEWAWKRVNDFNAQCSCSDCRNNRGKPDDFYRWPLQMAGLDFPPITYRRRKCLRVPPVNTLMARVVKGQILHAAWAGKDARRGPHGLICPHRGTNLGSVPPNADGTVTCPLHGLKFCAATGKSVPTHGAKNG